MSSFYCVEIWSNISEIHSQQIITLQKLYIRVISFCTYLTHIKDFFVGERKFPLEKIIINNASKPRICKIHNVQETQNNVSKQTGD